MYLAQADDPIPIKRDDLTNGNYTFQLMDMLVPGTKKNFVSLNAYNTLPYAIYLTCQSNISDIWHQKKHKILVQLTHMSDMTNSTHFNFQLMDMKSSVWVRHKSFVLFESDLRIANSRSHSPTFFQFLSEHPWSSAVFYLTVTGPTLLFLISCLTGCLVWWQRQTTGVWEF